MACILLWSSDVRVHDSQAYRKMDVTRKHIRHVFELREILLSIQTGFNLVNAVVLCNILESISGWNPHQLSCDCLKLLSIYFNLCFDVTSVVCHELGLLGTDLHATG